MVSLFLSFSTSSARSWCGDVHPPYMKYCRVKLEVNEKINSKQRRQQLGRQPSLLLRLMPLRSEKILLCRRSNAYKLSEGKEGKKYASDEKKRIIIIIIR
eukprot:gene507-277_t